MNNLVQKQHLSLGEENEIYWEQFYKKFNLEEESTFCKYIKSQLNKNTQIIDIGCGTGRDTRSFAKDGYPVIGVDRSYEAIKNNIECLDKIGKNENIKFDILDVSDKNKLKLFLYHTKINAKKNNNKILVYTRFFLHSINEENELMLLESLEKVLEAGDLFAAEFRTIEDATREKIYQNHYRRYIDSEKLLVKLQLKHSFKVKEFTKGTGFSYFNGEDPFLGRLLVEKI